jgi:ribA/ribD-fused uncharacterized protein
MDIKEFNKSTFFLSNFFPSKITFCGKEYPSVEHFYQAVKATDEEDHDAVMEAETPGKAKKIGRQIKMRDDWEFIKLDVMCLALRMKFSDPSLKQQLLFTGDAELEEGNTWGDKFWGIDLVTGEGENMLGKALMELRKDLRG